MKDQLNSIETRNYRHVFLQNKKNPYMNVSLNKKEHYYSLLNERLNQFGINLFLKKRGNVFNSFFTYSFIYKKLEETAIKII
jgi:hypothetical protein